MNQISIKIILASLILCGCTFKIQAQVAAQKIGNNPTVISPSAVLEVDSPNKGVLLPKIALTSATDNTTIAAPASSLLIYNTATAGTAPNEVTPGFYYWDGTATRWSRINSPDGAIGNEVTDAVLNGGLTRTGTGTALDPYKLKINDGTENEQVLTWDGTANKWIAAASTNWKLTGNTGTTAATNFIGTTDAVDFVTKTNNAEVMRVTSAGNVGIGTTAPAHLLDVVGSGIAKSIRIATTSNHATFFEASTNNSNIRTRLQSNRESAMIGTLTNHPLNFTTNAVDRMVIDANGNVGIGTNDPLSKLDVNGTIAAKENIIIRAIAGAAGTASAGISFQGDGVSHANIAYKPNERMFSIQTGVDPTSLVDNWGPAGLVMTGSLGIGTTTPATKLHIDNGTSAGAITIVDGTQGAGKVLTSDADGKATWQAASSGWGLTGNAGTTPGTNFIGTTDAVDFVTKTNNVERMRIDAKGYVGIGVAPNNWLTSSRVVQVGNGGAIEGRTNSFEVMRISANTYLDNAGTSRYIGTGNAMVYEQFAGKHSWFTAPSGAADAAITFTQAMTLTNGGNLGIGTAAPTKKLEVVGSDALINGVTVGTGPENISSNTVIGKDAMSSNNGGFGNTAIGSTALKLNTSGRSNTATGSDALFNNSSGTFNTANGAGTLNSNTTGSSNTAFGWTTLFNNTTGSKNTAIGQNTGIGIVTGNANTILGANVTGLASNLSNNIIIADGDGNRRINVDAAGNVGIGTTTPATKLHIDNGTTAGAITIVDGTQGAGKVLTSDATGKATWQAASSGWGLTGNAGTTAATNFIGTTDAVDFVTKTNNVERMRIDTNGNVGIGVTPGAETVSCLYLKNNFNITAGGPVSYYDSNVAYSSAADRYIVDGAAARYQHNSGSHRWYTATAGTAGAATFFSERMTLDINGNLGIGTAAPTKKLEVVGSDALINGVTVGRGSGNFDSNTAIGLVALNTNVSGTNNVAVGKDALLTNTNGSKNVAIGTGALMFNGAGNDNIAIGFNSFSNAGSGSNNIVIGTNANTSSTTVSNEVTIGKSGMTYRIFGTWSNASDQRYKNTITPSTLGLNLLTQLKPVTYYYKNSTAKNKSYGFIAQEVQQALKALGKTEQDGLVTIMEEKDQYLGLNYTEFVPILTKGIQEQQVQIQQLQSQLQQQQASINVLLKEMEMLKQKVK